MKILYFDTETTGLYPFRHSLIQIAGLIEIDGEIKEQFDFKCKPTGEIDPKALEIQNRTEAEIMEWPSPLTVYKSLLALFDKYVDKFNPDDFMIPAGQNVGFDLNFLFAFWPDKFLGSYLKGFYCMRTLSTMAYMDGRLKALNEKNRISFKLEHICKALGVEPGKHDALRDILATRECIKKLTDPTGLNFY